MMINLRCRGFLPFFMTLLVPSYLAAASLSTERRKTVIESDVKLMWQQGEQEKKDWIAAIVFCENFSLEGHDDWRLPDVKELASLADRTRQDPALDKDYFPNANSSSYWTNTTYTSSTYAYCVNFVNGSVGYCNKTQEMYVRCVRTL